MHGIRQSELPPDRAVDPRRADLRRMRTIATLLLLLMTLIFVATTSATVDWPWIPYVRAFAEAGMVGACADWFAVVALFRHPMGLPIPHTAIVPNNKERIGGALGRFITNNFLTARVISRKLVHVDVVGWAAARISDPANSRRLADAISLYLPRIIRSVPAPEVGEFLGKLARQGIETIPAAPLASKLLEILWAQGEAQAMLDRGLVLAESSVTANRDYIRQKVSEQSSRWIPKWIDQMIADKVMSGLLATLSEMRDSEHPWRIELRSAVHKLVADLASDQQMYAQGEAFKAELLTNPLFIEQARTLWTEVERGLHTGLPEHADVIARIRARHAQHRKLVAGRSGAQGPSQPPDQDRGTARIAAASLRDRRLHRARRAGLGQHDAGRQDRVAGRQGFAIHPHQWNAGWRAGRPASFRCLEMDRGPVACECSRVKPPVPPEQIRRWRGRGPSERRSPRRNRRPEAPAPLRRRARRSKGRSSNSPGCRRSKLARAV